MQMRHSVMNNYLKSDDNTVMNKKYMKINIHELPKV